MGALIDKFADAYTNTLVICDAKSPFSTDELACALLHGRSNPELVLAF